MNRWSFFAVLVLVGGAVAAFAIYTWGWRDTGTDVRTNARPQTNDVALRLETLRALRLINSTTGTLADNQTAPESIEPFVPGRWLVRYHRPSGIRGSYCMLIDPQKYNETHSRAGFEFVPCEIGP